MKSKKICLLLSSIFFLALSAESSDFKQYTNVFENKTILITGGTGFIGRALIKHIIKLNPKKIVVFSRDEVKHHKLQQKFNHNKLIKCIVGDIRDYQAIAMATRNVDMVLHTAALKRIDLLEYHALESIQTNVDGTENIARACIINNVKTALLVSTDKACSPINIYGACKFLAEKIFTNFGSPQGPTRFIAVRYGNVLNSTGSVIPFFCDKIKKNEPIPLTDERMTRFFISKEQAIELIFKALKYGNGGEVFVPIIPAFRVPDLIEALQSILQQAPPVKIVGLRPGEKIHELMINTTEIPRTYAFEGMYVITPSITTSDQVKSYARFGKNLNIDQFPFYSSGDSVLSKDALKKLLEKYNIVKI